MRGIITRKIHLQQLASHFNERFTSYLRLNNDHTLSPMIVLPPSSLGLGELAQRVVVI
jgi:hypothetical protein